MKTTTAQNKFVIWKLVFGICLELVFWNLLITQTQAQSALGLSAIPPRLEVSAKPGEVLTREIKVRNESNTDRDITVSSKDFIVTDDTGTPVQLDELTSAANRWASADWIQVSPSSFRLKPGETRSLMATIIVPDDALPGGHYSMILHTPKNEAVLNETGSYIETNVGTLVYITIPGTITEKALVKDFAAPVFSEYGPINFKSTINNLSDVHITPAGSIIINNWFGGKTASLPLSNINIFPKTSRHFENTLDRRWLFGRYRATLNAAYGTTGQVATATIFFWVIPWRLLLLLLLAAILIFVIIKLLPKKGQPPSSEESEHVEELEKELAALKKKYQDRK